MSQLTLIDSINLALEYEMNIDSSIVLLGEDIATNGGVFRATNNLQQKFGKNVSLIPH